MKNYYVIFEWIFESKNIYEFLKRLLIVIGGLVLITFYLIGFFLIYSKLIGTVDLEIKDWSFIRILIPMISLGGFIVLEGIIIFNKISITSNKKLEEKSKGFILGDINKYDFKGKKESENNVIRKISIVLFLISLIFLLLEKI